VCGKKKKRWQLTSTSKIKEIKPVLAKQTDSDAAVIGCELKINNTENKTENNKILTFKDLIAADVNKQKNINNDNQKSQIQPQPQAKNNESASKRESSKDTLLNRIKNKSKSDDKKIDKFNKFNNDNKKSESNILLNFKKESVSGNSKNENKYSSLSSSNNKSTVETNAKSNDFVPDSLGKLIVDDNNSLLIEVDWKLNEGVKPLMKCFVPVKELKQKYSDMLLASFEKRLVSIIKSKYKDK